MKGQGDDGRNIMRVEPATLPLAPSQREEIDEDALVRDDARYDRGEHRYGTKPGQPASPGVRYLELEVETIEMLAAARIARTERLARRRIQAQFRAARGRLGIGIGIGAVPDEDARRGRARIPSDDRSSAVAMGELLQRMGISRGGRCRPRRLRRPVPSGRPDLRLTTFVPVKKKDTKVLPMAGLIFQPKETISIYSSYSTSFVPVAATAQDNFGNNPFSPTTANSIEAGIKAELFDRKVTVTSAVFDIKKKNTLNTFNCLTQAQLIAAGITIPPGATIASGTCSNQLGGERSKGFEIEFNGTPLPGWSLTGGYAFTNAKVTSSNIAVQNGARLTNSPRNSFNLWSRYDFESGPLENLGFGLGLAYVGNRAGLLPTQANDPRPGGGTMPLGSYFTVDLGIYYEPIENLNITLKATNLLDERYIENSGFAAELQTNPGTPRQLTATVRYKF